MGIGDGGASPSPPNRGRGRGRVPDSGQIGDGDGGASPPPGKSGTDAPSPSPDKSGTGTGTGTGVSAPCFGLGWRRRRLRYVAAAGSLAAARLRFCRRSRPPPKTRSPRPDRGVAPGTERPPGRAGGYTLAQREVEPWTVDGCRLQLRTVLSGCGSGQRPGEHAHEFRVRTRVVAVDLFISLLTAAGRNMWLSDSTSE
jgi:hypothetical protein